MYIRMTVWYIILSLFIHLCASRTTGRSRRSCELLANCEFAPGSESLGLNISNSFLSFFWVNLRLNEPRPKPKAAICANSTSKYPIFTWKEGKACFCVCCIRRLLQAYDISDYNKSFGRLCRTYLYLHWNE